ncbi:alpha/beta hydrolase [Bradyrhizobium sp. KBS0727]|uniref:alpha/beta fold hydrolase n=1 Tax=unclassified Bradyrhizobium TaxID=2631580 RepID=UPI00110E6B50|nr:MULTISPECIES: alpha/beta hydrolase [unclassified Bradyrhizobium]QDW40556.1 alpha/beta hydrolase [Bradyrhizobium sp. KBS0725]QDW47161.1 alpha/beta hydrolase [Bradyrhizobium sp. KBS0727]
MIGFEQFGTGEHKLIGMHGWFGNEDTFKSLQLSLDPRKYQCAWLAHRGYGRSVAVAGNYSMAEMADDALAVADNLGWTSFSVIGHSMGAKAAQVLATRVPSRVKKLIAVTPVSADPIPLDPQTRSLFEAATRSPESRRSVIDFSTGGRLSSVWIDQLACDSIARSTSEASAAYLRSWADDDFSGSIRRCEIQTLVVVGVEDPSITPQLCELGFRSRYPHLAIVAMQNSGHYPMDEIPLAFGATVAAFLQSSAGQR